MKVAVIAHRGKSLGAGLNAWRTELVERGVVRPIWVEVDKSRQIPKKLASVVKDRPDLVIAWGGDGTVQRCAHGLAGSGIPLGIIPAGTANLFATNLELPADLEAATEVALFGNRTPIDVGRVNGDVFTVMAGAGFDAALIGTVDKRSKSKLGALAYAAGTAKAMGTEPTAVSIEVDGELWYSGQASCVLFGNVSTAIGGLRFFEHADLHDGRLDVAVVAAESRLQWLRVLGRVVAPGDPAASPFVQTAQARKIDVRFCDKVRYELDGGARGKTRELKVRAKPDALVVALPAGSHAAESGKP